MAVKIVTDSVADQPPWVTKELGITVVAIDVRFGDIVYRDGIDLAADEFYARLVSSKILPVISVPPPVLMTPRKPAVRLSTLFPEERIYRSKTTPAIGTHTGPGLLLGAVMGDKG